MSLKAILLTAIAVLGSVTAVARYGPPIGFDAHAERLAQELQEVTGRAVEIRGGIELGLGFNNRFIVRDIRVANAPWAARGDMARVGWIEARIAILPLFLGELRFDRLRVFRPDLWLEADQFGKVNWALAPAPAAPPTAGEAGDQSYGVLPRLDLDRIEMVGGRISYRDAATGDIQVVIVETGFVTAADRGEPFSLDVKGRWNALSVGLAGSVGPAGLGSDGNGASYPIDLTGAIGGLQIHAVGNVADPLRGGGTRVRIAAHASSLAELEFLVGRSVSRMSGVSLSTSLSYRDRRLDLTNLNIGGPAGKIAGLVSIDYGKPVPVVTAELHAPRLDLVDLVSRRDLPDGGRQGDAWITAGLPQSEGLFAALPKIQGSARLSSDAVEIGGAILRDVLVDLNVKKGVLRARPMRARLDDSTLEGRIRLDARQSPASLTASVKSPGFNVGPFLQRLDVIRTFGGQLSATVSVAAQGDTAADLLSTFRGEALLAMGPGRLSLVDDAAKRLDLSSGNPAVVFGMLVAQDETDADIECAASRFVFGQGIARNVGTQIRTTHANITGDGEIDLRRGSYDLRFTPREKETQQALSDAVVIRGTLARPVLAAEPAASPSGKQQSGALASLRRLFARERRNLAGNPCLKAVPKTGAAARAVERKPVPQPVAPAPPVPIVSEAPKPIAPAAPTQQGPAASPPPEEDETQAE